jgi:hypothetical protein
MPCLWRFCTLISVGPLKISSIVCGREAVRLGTYILLAAYVHFCTCSGADDLIQTSRCAPDFNIWDQQDSAGCTPLHECAARNLHWAVQLLVDAGADVNSKHGRNGLTPLQVSCHCVFFICVRLVTMLVCCFSWLARFLTQIRKRFEPFWIKALTQIGAMHLVELRSAWRYVHYRFVRPSLTCLLVFLTLLG